MFSINDNFLNVSESYLFSEVGRRIAEYQKAHRGVEIIRMGIGDVTRPLCPAVIEAMHKAVDDLAASETFRGYGPEQGYDFLRDKIAEYDYKAHGVNISPDEIFVSDGAKSDLGNFLDILSPANTVALTDPVYPVYLDTNIMAGRLVTNPDGTPGSIEMLPCTAANGFVPALPARRADIIYLCYPNNPTGTALKRDELKVWVDYAREHRSLILFDSAYEAFITDPDVPHSIYEIEGAKEVAVEIRSFSKTAGFTGLRCGYTVVPRGLTGLGRDGGQVELRNLWNRRQCTKFNGASYVAQRAAEAIYTEDGHRQIIANIDYYRRNAALLRQGLKAAGLEVYGGENAPYIWVKAPDGMSSWAFFGLLLDRYHIACTPGVGFGPSGEDYVRLTAFGTYESTQKAVASISALNTLNH